MKNLIIISFLHFVVLNGFGQTRIGLSQFKVSLNDSIQKALTYPNEEFIISLKMDNQFITFIGACNEITRDSLNQGCVMTELFFDSKKIEDVRLLDRFKMISFFKEYTYLYSDMEFYYKNHGNNYTSCIEDVVKILLELFDVKEYSNIIIKLKEPSEME